MKKEKTTTTTEAKPKKPFYKKWWFWVIIAVLVLGGGGAATTNTDTPADTPADPPAVEEEADETVATPEEETVVDEFDTWTAEQQNAYKEGIDYLNYTAFSKQGLIDQLSSEYGGQYPIDVATFAVEKLEERKMADWYEEAERSAQQYLEYSSFSKQELIDQLSSEYGEKFTRDQAEKAVEKVYQ